MRILLDHNLDRRLKHQLKDDEVRTTQEMGWANVSNGELLSLAEQNGFDTMLTADSNIKNQQNLQGRNLSLVILRSFDNRLATHIEMVEQIHGALNRIRPGEIIEAFHPHFRNT